MVRIFNNKEVGQQAISETLCFLISLAILEICQHSFKLLPSGNTSVW